MFVRWYLKAAISYDKDVRVETYPFARAAIREAFFNALVHSKWQEGNPIQIKIRDNEIFISNSCSFPEGWTVQNLLKPHKSVPFNPDIANAFYKAGYIETWGRGIEKIISACREIGAKDPEYEVEFGDITIRFEAIALDYTSDKASNKTSDKALREALNDALNEEERRILKAIIEQPRMSQEELVEKTGYSRSKIQRKMKQLKNKGFIYRAGAKKNGAWVVAGVTEEN